MFPDLRDGGPRRIIAAEAYGSALLDRDELLAYAALHGEVAATLWRCQTATVRVPGPAAEPPRRTESGPATGSTAGPARTAPTAGTNGRAVEVDVLSAARKDDRLGRALQRAIADRAPLLQRYHESAPARSTGDLPASFRTQRSKPVLQPVEIDSDETANRLPYDIVFPPAEHAAGNVPLLVADDDSMAIHKTIDEPKEFYAVTRVVEHANDALALVDSTFRLETAGGETIAVGGNKLRRVRPLAVKDGNNARADPHGEQRHRDMLVDICMQICGLLIGNRGSFQSEVVLGGGAEPLSSFPISPGSQSDARVRSFTHHLANSTAPTATAAAEEPAAGLRDDEVATSAEAYGRAVGSGAMDATARALRINQYATPRVGEGLATFINAGTDPTQDYAASPQPVTRTSASWGYHYAGVVAASLKGDDFVTLENYNRTPDIASLFPALHGLVLERLRGPRQPPPLPSGFAALVSALTSWAIKQAEDALAHLSLPPDADEYSLKAALREVLDAVQMPDEYQRLILSPRQTEAWFFRMYGTQKPGQSFHETEVESGDFVNALTVRVRKRDAWVNALRTERDLLRRLTTDAFDDGARGTIAGLLNPVRTELLFLLEDELSDAERAVEDRWDPSTVRAAKEHKLRMRSAALATNEVQALRDHLRGLISSTSEQDRNAARELLDRLSAFTSPSWFP